MKVIIDSNILYENTYSKKLRNDIAKFVKECNALRVAIVLPSTVVAEVDRGQRDMAKKAKENIIKSVNLLKDYKFSIEDFSIDEVVNEISIIDKFKENGALIEIIEPTLEIFEKAHKSATEHLPPCIKKEDEMRDLIIWEIACDVSRKEEGALLISNDELFWGDQGDDIANKINLLRVRTVDDALGALEVGTPARTAAELVLKDIWDNLTTPPLPLDKKATIKRVYNVSFIERDNGLKYASFHTSIANINGKIMEADFQINFFKDKIDVGLSEIIYDGKKFRERRHRFSQGRAEVVYNNDDYDSKLASLRNLIGV